jgi:hypothetical protein
VVGDEHFIVGEVIGGHCVDSAADGGLQGDRSEPQRSGAVV